MIIFQNWKRIAFSDDLSKVSGHLRQEELHSPVQKNLTQIQLPNPHFAPIHRKHAYTHTAPWGNKDESSLFLNPWGYSRWTLHLSRFSLYYIHFKHDLARFTFSLICIMSLSYTSAGSSHFSIPVTISSPSYYHLLICLMMLAKVTIPPPYSIYFFFFKLSSLHWVHILY